MSITLVDFLRLTTVILDYLRYTRLLPYLTSIFHVACKFYLTHHCIWQVNSSEFSGIF